MVSRYVSNYFDMTKGEKVFTVQPSAIYNKLPKFVSDIVKCTEKHKSLLSISFLWGLYIGLWLMLFKFIRGKISKSSRGKGMLVRTEKCVGCMKCVNECPNNVFVKKDGKALAVNLNDCTGCLGCLHRCPAGAITSVCGKMDNFKAYKFQEYYVSEKKGYVAVDELKQDFEKRQ